jgi:hypothetical protein
MDTKNRKSFLEFLRRASFPMKALIGKNEQKKSGGYNGKRERLGRTGDTSGKGGNSR